MEKKPSSIDKFVQQLKRKGLLITEDSEYIIAYLEAKAMHKEEVESAYCKAGLDIAHNDSIKESGLAQEYYNETFGGREQSQ
jgi:hypothetical protein